MKFKTGDHVVVITGKDKGKTGKIMRILMKSNKVVVEKVNIITKHIKKSGGQSGQIVKLEAPLNASNVMIVDPETKKRSRISYKKLETGKKQRVYSKSKKEIKDPEKGTKTKKS